MKPGEVLPLAGTIEVNAGLESLTLAVHNRSVRPVRISSHYPFWLANPRLEFDRGLAEGCRLDIPAGATVRWAPGETREVRLVRIRGDIPSESTPNA